MINAWQEMRINQSINEIERTYICWIGPNNWSMCVEKRIIPSVPEKTTNESVVTTTRNRFPRRNALSIRSTIRFSQGSSKIDFRNTQAIRINREINRSPRLTRSGVYPNKVELFSSDGILKRNRRAGIPSKIASRRKARNICGDFSFLKIFFASGFRS